MQVQSNGAGASTSEAVEAMEAADNVAGLQQKDQRDYQKSKGQKISRGIYHWVSLLPKLTTEMSTKLSSKYKIAHNITQRVDHKSILKIAHKIVKRIK